MSAELTIHRARNWLRSDMKYLRWVLLGLYLLLIIGLILSAEDDWELSRAAGLLGIMLVGQGVLIFGTGTIQLCRPMRRRRLVLPVIAAAAMLTVLCIGLFTALSELFYVDHYWNDVSRSVWIPVLLSSWCAWGLLLWSYVWRWERFRLLSRLAGILLTGSLAQLLATVPSHLIVSRRPGCLVGIGTMVGIIAGVYVMLFSFGPMIAVLFLRPRYRRERLTATPFCRQCGYDLRASKDRCPECGTPVVREPAESQAPLVPTAQNGIGLPSR
jgi:hypothetical protein